MRGDPELICAIRDVPDFPKPGIIFKDITPILGNGQLFRKTIDLLSESARAHGATKIAGIDARGFLFGATVADRLGLGFVPIRKKGKLPWKTCSVEYELEYGKAEIEIHTDAFAPGEKVALVDDLLATGGTAAASVQLIQSLGADVAAAIFLIELEFLKGREQLKQIPVDALIQI